jgi:hypothetical protein
MFRTIKRRRARRIARAIDELVGNRRRGAQADLDALLGRASELDAVELRMQVREIFVRHGFSAPDEDVERCVNGLERGERVELTYDPLLG